MLKVVIDTNIFISALHWAGVPLKVYKSWLDGEFRLGISREILSELGSVLENDFDWAHEETQDLCNLINELADIAIPKQKLRVITDDPDDNKILECALASRADYIISGDKHLLKLGAYKTIPIITGRRFLNLLASRKRP